ncbi:LOW QUALITY PROTEIN: DNA-binding protein RFX8 [Coturnix japonica]|uniref:LOW QUALITY PROTEIN: DNA-binding protein RFX8 n=1 Tax=Coturnix japonica TaxID=93934 RepID=UPI0007777047|nr:LOW QUALITY PROTEIN: DNA-binding protein RFX8 [Coturnix japonica]
MAEGSPTSLLHLSITRWIADNFCLCEGCTIPRWLLYEMYIENFSSNDNDKVNSATFGKLIRLVFPGLGTRRLGTRGSARYHYDGIAIKKDSSFYGRYCFLLSQKNYRRQCSPGKSVSAWQPSTPVGTGADACSSGDAAGYESNSKKRGTDLHCFPSITYLKTEEDRLAYVLPEFGLACPWEQELLNKYPYEMVIQIANEYNSHCQDILQVVKMQELDKVEDCITSFWKSLQPEKIAFISLPDICQLFKYYDRYLFKEMDNILLGDFLEEVSVHYLKSIRTFSKNVKLWLLNALEELPMPLQTSKCKEVTVFIKRLRRKTDLSNMAKTMRIVLNNYSKVTVLISDLNAVISQGLLDVPGNLFQKKYGNPDELRYNIEIKCLNDLLSSLAQSTEFEFSLSCVSSNLQAFVIQQDKQEFRKLAADFQLRWNFLLCAVSKAMTLNYADSFGSWHLFNLLLLDYVAHVFQSYIEEGEEGEESFCVTQQSDQPVSVGLMASYFGHGGYFSSAAAGEPPAEASQSTLIVDG